jgi:hypothetical protein
VGNFLVNETRQASKIKETEKENLSSSTIAQLEKQEQSVHIICRNIQVYESEMNCICAGI